MEQERSSVAQNDAIDAALDRSDLYRWLSLAFRYPDADPAAHLQTSALIALETMLERIASEERDVLRPVLTSLRARCADRDLAALQSDHRRVFGHIESSLCPPYETRYDIRHLFQQTQQLADIAGFYRAFGLELSDDANERPDYLPIELEFLHFLCFKEAYALEHHGPEQVKVVRDAEAAFLRDHLLRWAPSFAGRLKDQAGDGFYEQLATLLLVFLRAEAARWKCDPAEDAPLHPLTLLPEGCNFSCGLDGQSVDELISER
ncbi:MAG: molecular chaperone TorD family protein [candidate division NC10 bacterium]|nr:molecular chaperone TorD family protein [candidate division NC10 bacterium]